MKNQIRNRFLILVGIFFFSLLIALPSTHLESVFGVNALTQKLSEYKVLLGLDLAGGTELDYRIDLTDAYAQNADDDPQNDVDIQTIAESVRDSLEARVNPAGVGEIVVQRSQVDNQEHVIIQMPPTANVEKAKQDAEKDNRLEFFEEMPEQLNQKRISMAGLLVELESQPWEEVVSRVLLDDQMAHQESFGPYFSDEILDPALAEKISQTPAYTIIPEIIETQTEMQTTISPEGELSIVAYPEPIIALVYVTSHTEETREKVVEASAEARHILFGYKGALRAPEDVLYETREDALTAAEELLATLQIEGTETFADKAIEYSTEPAAQTSGGNLGTFGRGDMTGAFDEAVFTADSTGLLPEVVETEFGFHIIEIINKTDESLETVTDTKYGYELLYWKTEDFVWNKTELSGEHLENAVAGYNELGQHLVNLLFNAEGGSLFADITGRVSSRTCNGQPCRLGIKVGGVWITQPTVREKIIGRMSQITGNFTPASARQLANDLNLGAIDAPVTLAGQVTITPQLGAEQLALSLKAGIYGFIATMIFMMFSYKLAGVIAAISLTFYALLFIVILKLWPDSFGGPIVLTLSGIAGIILSIGLAVDGNILIFERINEELKNGKSLSRAVDLGFERAWTAIRDSNLTTLLTCIILFSLGSSVIKGFAVTLIIGTLLSLFTAINVTRNLLRFLLLFPFFKASYLFSVSLSSTDNQ